MKKNILTIVYLLCVIILVTCSSQNNVNHLVPDDEYYNSEPEGVIAVGDIIETINGAGVVNLPDWMNAFIAGGIWEIEKIDFYRNKYLFIGENEGSNLNALNKWAENYSVVQDFPRLAAARIEKRLISASSLYPDDEYGIFFELFVKKAFDTNYPNVVKEDTYWIKINKKQENDIEQDEENSPSQVYKIFVFISIDKISLQIVIEKMMADVIAEVTPTRAQSASINRLQQTFFEVF